MLYVKEVVRSRAVKSIATYKGAYEGGIRRCGSHFYDSIFLIVKDSCFEICELLPTYLPANEEANSCHNEVVYDVGMRLSSEECYVLQNIVTLHIVEKAYIDYIVIAMTTSQGTLIISLIKKGSSTLEGPCKKYRVEMVDCIDMGFPISPVSSPGYKLVIDPKYGPGLLPFS